MKFKHYILAGVTALSFGMFVGTSQASASTWHSSAIPAKLRGTWHATGNYSYKFKITKHSFKYSGEGTVKRLKWRYVGNRFYRLKGSDGSSILVHYFNRHKMTSNSYWHTYRK